ncbi:MAG: EAL domain-containing protein [Blastochloris sp.]|nr:EAL domain-containing protein [Blastochloris sp.]
MSVNLSNKQFKHLNLNNDIDAILQQSGISADRLTLEIPETVIMEETEATAHTLKRLQAHGVQLCIDDFGTGQASLRHLYSFPLHSLKIDSSFVSCLEENERSVTMVHAMITLASNLGMEVIAEGVETAHQAAHLRALGCTYAQGFFFSNALESAAVEHLLGSH